MVAGWDTVTVYAGDYSAHIAVPDGLGNFANIVHMDIGDGTPVTLNDVSTIQFMEYLVSPGGLAGISAAVILFMSDDVGPVEGSTSPWTGVADNAITFHYSGETTLNTWTTQDLSDTGWVGYLNEYVEGDPVEDLDYWRVAYPALVIAYVSVAAGEGDWSGYEGYIDNVMVEWTGGVDTYLTEPRIVNTATAQKGYNYIQDAIGDASPDDTISVAAGTYVESLVIAMPLILQGPNAVISPNTGPRVAEAVITGMSPLVEVETGADVNPLTIEGFTFQDAIDGGNPAGVIRANGGTEGWGNVTIRSNRFIDNHGPAVVVVAATGSVNPADWTITDNLIDGVTGSSKSGIYLDLDSGASIENPLGRSGVLPVGFSGWVISLNTIKHIAYGGILVDDAVDMEISGNTIEDVQKAGIQSSGVSQNVTITGNVITRANSASTNLRAGIRLYGVDAGDTYHAATLIGPVSVTKNIVTDSYIGFEIKTANDITGKVVHVNGNSFTGNTQADLRHGGTGLLDATNNWWGSAAGPSGKIGGNVAAVDAEPWLLAAVVPGVEPTTYDNTVALNAEWSIVSPGAEVTGWVVVADSVGLVLAYDGGFVEVTDPDPIIPVFIKTVAGGGVGFNYAESSQGIFTTNLKVGWNLIGIPQTNALTAAILSPLRFGANGEVALATLVSQGNYNPSGESFYLAMLSEDDWTGLPSLHPFDGYWAYMNVAKEFGVVVVP